MGMLLNLCYLAALVAFSPWLLFAAIRKRKYREGFAEKFLGRVPRRHNGGKCVWLHAVSVGEVNMLGPLIMRIEEKHPAWQCVISTTTKTGFDVARKKYGPRCVFYCPLDFTWAVSRAVRRIRPDVLLLAELELWPNLTAAVKRAGGKVGIVNGRLSEKSFRGYSRIRPLVAAMLRNLDLIAVQNVEYAARFRQLGVDEAKIHVTGSVKFDGAQTQRDNPKTRQYAAMWDVQPTDIVFLVGSTQAPEEQMAISVFDALAPKFRNLRLMITPRHPERFDEVAAVLDRSNWSWQRRSHLEETGRDPNARILLVDAVGELAAWWGLAQIAFVGGSMGNRGGQNMIEPAAYGAAVSFGPNTRNFRDVVSMMLDDEAAVVVGDADELRDFVQRCLEDESYREQLGQRAQRLVVRQLGAADRTVELVGRMLLGLEKNTKPRRRPLSWPADIHSTDQQGVW